MGRAKEEEGKSNDRGEKRMGQKRERKNNKGSRDESKRIKGKEKTGSRERMCDEGGERLSEIEKREGNRMNVWESKE